MREIRSYGSLVVALSGGVDSAALLGLAAEALGPDRVLAVTGGSPSLAEEDLRDAERVAARLGVAHVVVSTREIENAEYRANTGDRCFHCRVELFEVLGRLAGDRGIERVAYGAITDDLGDHRPGMEAARRLGVAAPLIEAGIDKADVRRIATEAGLSVRDKPAAACLASRIPVGTEVTEERLGRVGRAEASLRKLGFRQLRVRHHGEVARLELDLAGQERLADPAVRREVVRLVRAAGFRHVAVDLEGYRSGGLDLLPSAQRTPPARDGGQ